MSSLAGIATRNEPLDAMKAKSQVELMGRVQKHREPDGWQVVTAPGLIYVSGQAGTDSEESASGLALAFDGKITNASDVRDALRKAGTQLRSNSDRELVLRAWETWGPKCLDQLHGRFAFVVHDSTRMTSYLVRDRFGHKPFYYALLDDRIYFASEIKALLALLSPPVLNELALVEWSMYGDVLPPRTLFRGIDTLPTGHVREIGARGHAPESHAYYELTSVVDPARYSDYASRSDAEMIDILDATLDRVMKNQIDGQHGGVGVLLSGGVDSAMIAALAAKHAKLRAYNFSFWSNSLDERRIAEKVAAKLGMPLESILFDGETYRRELARALWLFETPLWHLQGVAVHLLARRAFADGVRILLSGVSIGPLLGTSLDRYRWILPPPFLSNIPDGMLRVARKAVYSANGLPVGNPFFAQNLAFGVRMIDGGKRARTTARMNETYQFLSDFNERRIQVMRMSDNSFFLPRFFRQGDSLCMGESVEYCDAAVDADFMALALNLNNRLTLRKNKVSKWILKELAARHLPRDIAFQKKPPVWAVPVDQYFVPMFKESLFNGGFLDSHLGMGWQSANDLYKEQKETTQVLYRLINIEVWGRIFFLGQSVDEVSAMLQ